MRHRNLALLLLAPAIVAADWAPTVVAGGADGLTVRAADLDGDGDLDVVTGSVAARLLVAYENLGGGRFGPNRVLVQDVGVVDVRPADLDGDGDVDLLLSSGIAPDQGAQDVVWAENLGGGVFAPGASIGVGLFLGALGAWDVDGDDDLDPVTASVKSDEVAWYPNLGGGVFGAPVIAGFVADADDLAFADVDGDGDGDLVAGGPDERSWFPGVPGGLGAENPLPSGESAGVACAAADLDGDGDVDVLGGALGETCWNENLGGGTFGACHVVPTAYDVGAVQAVDLDGDGAADLLSGGGLGSTRAWQNAGGTFLPELRIGSVTSDDADAADLTGDGLPDVLVADDTAGLHWSQNLGGMAFGPSQRISTAVGPHGAVAADLDGDGDVDVVTGADGLSVHENVGGALGSAAATPAPYLSSLLRGALVGDFDGDGAEEVKAGPEIYRFDAATGLAAWVTLGDGCISSLAAGADFDGDGDLDLACAGLYLLLNEGGGVFAEVGPAPYLGGAPVATAVLDLDADGVPDIVAALTYSDAGCYDDSEYEYSPYDEYPDEGGGEPCVREHEIVWLRGLGDGTFGPVATLAEETGDNVELQAADVDGDGRTDIVARETSDIVWYANQGGGLSRAVIIGEGSYGATAMVVADLDSDGDIDVVSARAGELGWRDGLGGGQLAEEVTIATGTGDVVELGARDIDGDRGPDLLVTVQDRGALTDDADAVVWLRNPTPGPPLPADTTDTAGEPDTDVAPEPEPEPPTKAGCGCATSRPAPYWLAVLALGVARRRKAARPGGCRDLRIS